MKILVQALCGKTRCFKSKSLKECYDRIKKTPQELLALYIKKNDRLYDSDLSDNQSSDNSSDLFKDDDDIDTSISDEEIKKYLSVDEKPVSILDWWKKNGYKFKQLALVAKKMTTTLVISFKKEYYDLDFAHRILKSQSITSNQQDVTFLHFNKAN